MTRVLLVVANRFYGGAERHVIDLAGALAGRGHRVDCLFPGGSGMAGRLHPPVGVHEVHGLRSPPRFALSLLRLTRALRPDIVHLHSPRASMMGRLVLATLPARSRPAIVSTAHGWIPRRLLLRGVYEALYRGTAALEDATIAVSRDTARRLGPRSRMVRVVPNGVGPAVSCSEAPGARAARATRAAAPRSTHRPARLGFVGRLTQEKGFPEALAWFAGASSRLGAGAVCLEVFGDGPLLNAAGRRAALLATPGIRFHGWLSPEEVVGVMSDLSALLITSREEGMPYVLLEAMSAGCPVVSTAVGGIPEVIEHGVDGFLVAPGDTQAAASAIAGLVANPGLAARVGQAAKDKIAAAHSLEAMVRQTEEVYRTVLQRGP